MISRFKIVSGLFLLAASAVGLHAQIPSGPPFATGKAKFLGSAYSSPNQTLYFEKYWNQVTPENASKWGSVEATRNVMTWSGVDDAYNFAKQNGFPFKFHNLVWGNQQPAWITSLSTADQLTEITEWYAAAAARYPAIDFIDVVNEPLHAPASYRAALGGSGTTGWDWVITAFQMARQYFPNAKLLINEYSVENSASSAATYVQIINLLKARNLIDGIGIQGHAFSTTVPAATIKANLDTIAATGLPITISEFDIDGTDAVQLADYQRVFPIFWEHPAVVGVTLWGWRPGQWRGDQIVAGDSNNTERPAMQWLRTYVQGSSVAPTPLPSPQDVAAGGSRNLYATISGTGSFTYQWEKNGTDLAGATSAVLTLANIQPADTGLYAAAGTGAPTATVSAAIVGVASTSKVIGNGTELGANVQHPNGNFYDQVLLQGTAATVTADAGQVTRTSFIDLRDNIVQVEFSGAGTLSIVLDGSSGPAVPVNYNQPSVSYMKGNAGIVIIGADETTNVAIFTVGRATAFDPTGAYNFLLPISATNDPANNGSSLFVGRGATVYNGFANIAFVAISSSNGKFGGLRTANGSYLATKGMTGVYAPGVQFTGPVFIGDLTASDAATPVIMIGSSPDTRITGGDLSQLNSQAVQVSGLTQLKFTAGSDSGGNLFSAQSNKGVLMQNGVDVTAQIVVNPSP